MARKVSRRKFLAGGAAIAAATVLTGCEQQRRWVTLEPYVRPPEEQLAGVPTWYASTCRSCSAGCGIIVRVMNGRATKIEGNPEHPLNQGKLCAQGQAALQALYNPDRLTSPTQTVKPGSGDVARVPWDSALGVLAGKIRDAGNGVAILGSASMPGHIYDLFTRLARAVGAPAPVIWDLQSTWDGQASLAATGNQFFGRGGVPAYNVGGADVIFSFGADFLGEWVSPTRYGIEYGRFRTQPNGLRGYLVQFEPHMTLSGAKADQWVALRPGYEGMVAQAIARIIADQRLGPADRAGRAAAAAGNVDVNAVAQAAGVPLEMLNRLARIFADAAHPVAIPGNGRSGPNDVAASQALNTIAGGNAVLLSADPPIPDLVRPSASTYSDLQRLIDQMRSGAVKVLLVYGANPAYELPDQAGFVDAVSKVGYVATFSPFMTETAALSHLVLPERTPLESWGYQVVEPNFGVPTISSQQPVVQPLDDARSAADVLISLAKNVPSASGAFTWSDEVAFLKEQIAKLPAGAAGGAGPDLLWARFLQHGGWWPAQPPAPAAPTAAAPPAVNVTPPQEQGEPAQYPFYLQPFLTPLLGTGWGANIPWLQGSPEPLTSIAWQTWVAINPGTAQKLGVGKGDVVRVTTVNGSLEAPVYVYPAVRPDTIAVPLGQGHTHYGRYAENRGANVVRLLGSQAGPGGNAPAWAVVRCQVTRTGQTVHVATMEWTPGVEQGFSTPGMEKE